MILTLAFQFCWPWPIFKANRKVWECWLLCFTSFYYEYTEHMLDLIVILFCNCFAAHVMRWEFNNVLDIVDSYCDPVEVAAISGNPGDGVVTPVDCPAGYYCPSGTGAKSSFPCAVGTFSNTTQLQSQSQCQPCTGGYMCDTPGEDLESLGLSWPFLAYIPSLLLLQCVRGFVVVFETKWVRWDVVCN